ncbi:MULTISPECIES: L-Ala-D/L-Glu epimerase [Pseudothermotoga]|uniref:Dipeptide epimerase n=1 Tax=Pseudothermotoga lettingae (strain ATCC BAA-301 / DSM 14385 / NBRC 107922 / TMO) TaxID=416591 RepID=A8F554_PSELT|nr:MULTISPECIES: L-Ala-D/L-Glu epimerase [Pseudothermotoga]ABV33288.1 Mandelate racemase/muconate lactonizing protein [Pseudothermotoga lettingae TMO]MDI3493934.1 L-Ala-D/L-Glu epimerase [Pseudothermotoga sp.]MDK2884540.1 L-Ala-D/L-Glu epimerase [Pseudothermotoga sp.]GLI49795.1 L-Ala-D/L-Glu epimerase [Pseudothermotoga lettingae TMO]HBJ80619.1 dipeptide epimerase [Pseudothermotoga sp.]
MKITSISFKKTLYSYFEPFTISLGSHEEQENVEVCVKLKNGIEGYGEASSLFVISGETAAMLEKLHQTVEDILIGKDVESYANLFHDLQTLRATPAIKAAIEFAIVDAFCKQFNMKPYQFFGGSKNTLETDKTVGIENLENTIKKVKRIYDEGFRKIKIKVGRDVKNDIERVVKSKEVSPQASFIVDANQGFTPKEAVEFAKALYAEKVDVVIFEQPVNRYNIEGMRFVRFNSPYPVAADESVFTKYDALKLVREDAVDFINIKLMKSGLSDAMSIVHIAQAANIGLMIGCMGESSIGIRQSIHFAAGTGAFLYHDLDSHLSLKEESFRGDFVQDGPFIILE